MKKPAKKKQETMAQIENRVKKEVEENQQKEAHEKEKRQKAEDKKIHKLSGKELKDLTAETYNTAFREGQLKLLDTQLKQEEIEKEKPVTIADQLKQLEEKIKYQRLQELKKINDRKLISLINSISRELEITQRSLLVLEKIGMVHYISRSKYEKALKSEGLPSRINSTTRKNLNIILWAVEQLRVCAALLGLGKGTGEVPLELYPVSKSTHNQEMKEYFKLAQRRKRKAEAILRKQEKE